MTYLQPIVEGTVDGEVARVLAAEAGFVSLPPLQKNGRTEIAKKVRDYLRASAQRPFFVLADLDSEPCPGALLGSWGVPSYAPSFACRIAVHEIEAWLLADRAAFARYLKVEVDRIPHAPERVVDPKRFIVELAESSSSSQIRLDLIPRPRSHRREGPAYTSRLVEFVRTAWRPAEARRFAPSLDSCLTRLQQMHRSFSPLITSSVASTFSQQVSA